MCLDFRSLNQACPKDTYPLPRIDVMVDHTVGYEVMSFLDAFSGYHQVGWPRKMRRRRLSSLTMAPTATGLCPSVSRMPVLPINA
ncbi:RNA-directed DNA polymerase like [Apostasia shenzhenica]|uniref:RNA-directed DNA polymerase like n=1 Tax=Apostasia shenzhenica TaxID=1088818 RepID=A0A2I0B430_9ASPA|nr:RNA-directed DNA polymerase like [Apostasia shenzhenica]